MDENGAEIQRLFWCGAPKRSLNTVPDVPAVPEIPLPLVAGQNPESIRGAEERKRETAAQRPENGGTGAVAHLDWYLSGLPTRGGAQGCCCSLCQ